MEQREDINTAEHKDDAYSQQLEARVERLRNLMVLFREKVNALEKTVNTLEEKVSSYAIELTKAHKITQNE